MTQMFSTNIVRIFASGIGMGQAEYLPAQEMYAGYLLGLLRVASRLNN